MVNKPKPQVKVIAHSKHWQRGMEVLSFQLRYWRPIHSEVMTHRDFGRNARSSRAVPVMTLLNEEIFVPDFGMNQAGMQASDLPVPEELQRKWEKEWCQLAEINRAFVEKWGMEGMHKQWANRPLEWFGWIDVLITSTNWANFFALRNHPAAQPEFRELAQLMLDAKNLSKPRILQEGEWHLPYVSPEERSSLSIEDLLKLSTARCARLSYKPFDGNADYESEFNRYIGLVVNQPVHASPSEHQCTPDYEHPIHGWGKRELWGNLRGFIQHRKMIPNERVYDTDYVA